MMKYEERVAARGRREEALGTAERRGGQVINEKSKTEIGKLDLPTVPEMRSGSTKSDKKGGKP
jgi:hypothetical protein